MTDNKQRPPTSTQQGSPFITPPPTNQKGDKSMDTNQTNNDEKNNPEKKEALLHAEIKKSWSKLSDEEIKLHEKESTKFFGTLKEKYGINKEEAQKKLQEIKSSCGCDSQKVA